MSLEEYHAKLPRKRIVAAVVAFCGDRLLIVKPTYQEHWLVPGGVVEAYESPLEAARREFREEIGITVDIERLLAIDYAKSDQPFKDEALHFVFRARNLTEEEISKVSIPKEELSEHRLLKIQEALPLLGPALGRRIESALQGGAVPSVILTEGGFRLL